LGQRLEATAYRVQGFFVRVQSELALGIEIAAVPQAGDRREVVGGDGAQGPSRKRLRQAWLEPQAAVREDGAASQRLTHAVLDCAQVFADDERAGPCGFEGQDAEQVVRGVADVPSGGWG